MRKTFTRILSAIMAVVMLVGLVPMMTISSSAAFNDTSLKFDENGEFTVIQLTDVQDDTEVHETTLALIAKAMQRYEPDLVVLTGDNVESGMNESEFKTSVSQFMAPIIAAGVRYAVTFGNHDAEDKSIVNTAWDKESQYNHYISMSSLAIDFDEDSLSGVGTGSIPIYSNDGSRVAFCVFPIDSGMYDENDDYDFVKTDQINWYASESARLATLNNGNLVPTLVFQHIPVPEVYSNLLVECSANEPGAVSGQTPNYSGKYWKLDPNNSTITGILGEGPCPPTQNNGQYQGWLDVGNVVGAFFGHDHKNSFVGTDANGITMGYSKAATLEAYHSDDNDPGVRVFNIKEDGTYTTEQVTYNGMLTEDKDYERDVIAGTPTVPEVIYVGAADNGIAKQEYGTAIQLTSLNHATQALYPNDLTVTVDLSNAVSNVTLTAESGINMSAATVTAKDDTTNTYTWQITGGNANAGTAAEFKISYDYEGVTLHQYAYSSVDNIKSPAGHYVFSRVYRGANNSDNFNTQRYLMTVLGENVYGNARAASDVALANSGHSDNGDYVGSWTNAPAGYYNYTLADDEGFVQKDTSYGINFMSPSRVRQHYYFPRFTQAGSSPVATAYIDVTEYKNLTGVGITVNYWRHQAPDNGITTDFTVAFKSGDVGYTTSDWNTGTVDASVISTQNATVTLLNARGSNVSHKIVGADMPENGATYTLISQGYSYWNENYDTPHYTYTPVLLKFVTYNKSDLRSLLNSERTAMRQLEDNITYRAAFKEAFRQVQKPNTTQEDIDAAQLRLEKAIEALSFTGTDISNNSEYYANSTVPTRLYVAGSGYGLSAQPKGTTIQAQIINYRTRAMIDYSNFGITLPNGATNATVEVVNQTTGAAVTYTWDAATASGKVTGGTANVGDIITYKFSYELNGKAYTQVEASAVADAPQASGWLTFIRRTRQWAWDDHTSQMTSLYFAPEGVPAAGIQYEALQGTAGYDNAYYGVNLTNFSGEGSQKVSGFGINSWIGPSRTSTGGWYAGSDGDNDTEDVGARAKFNVYFDSSVVSNITDAKIMFVATSLGASDGEATGYAQQYETYYFGQGGHGAYGSDLGNLNSAAVNSDGATRGNSTLTTTAGDSFYKYLTVPGLATGAYTYYTYVWTEPDSGRALTLHYSWHINLTSVDKTDLHNIIAQEDEYFRQLSDGYSDANGKFTAYQAALAKAKGAAQDASLTAAENASYVTALQKAIDELEYQPADYTKLNAKIAEIVEIYYTNPETQEGRYFHFRPNIDVDPLYYAREEYYDETYFNVSINEMIVPLEEILDNKMNLDIRYQAEVDSYVDVLDIGWQSAQLRAADYTAVDQYLGYKVGTNPNGSTGGLTIVLPDIEKYSMFTDLENRNISWEMYTTDSYNAWANACAPAMSNRNLKSPDQATVKGYADALTTAYNALELKTADYTTLNNTISEATQNIDTTVEVVDPSNAANNYDISYYDADYIAQLRAKIAEKVDGLYILQQEDVDVLNAEIDALYIALGNHLNDADFKFANEQKAIEATYESEYAKYYTTESWDRLVAARAAVTEAENFGYMAGEQVTVNALAQEVYDALNALDYNEANYNAVNAALEKIAAVEPNKDDYVDWSGVQTAVDSVVTGLDITKQTEVDDMAKALEDAYAALKLKDADYTKLNTQITAANAAIAQQSLYTPGSYANFLAVYNTALSFYMAEPKVDIQHQYQVDEQEAALKAAIEQLEYVDADIAPLEEAIGYYYSVDYFSYEMEYTTDTDGDGVIDVYEDVDAAFQVADALMTKYSNDELDIRNNDEIKDAAQALNTALNNLPALYADVDWEIEQIPADLTIYTDESVKRVNDAVAAVNRNLKITDQETIYEYAAAINEAVSLLEEKAADLTALKNAITAADEKIAGVDTSTYTDDSWAKFEEAYNNAVDIRDADPALLYSEQETVDAATEALVKATAGLTKKGADYDALDEAVKTADALVADEWTPETWAGLVKALADAKAVARDLTVDDQATIDAATKALTDAIKALVKAEIPLELKVKEGSTTVIDKDRGFIYGLDCAGVNAYSDYDYVTDLVAQNFVEIEGDGRLEYTYVGSNTVLGTGAKVEFINNKTNEVVETYYIVLFGDNNGDGTVTLVDTVDAIDYFAWNDCTHDYEDFTNPAVFAMDVDGNGEVTLNDFVVCSDYLAWNCDYIPQVR